MNFSKDVVAAHMRGVSGYDKNGGEILDPKPVEIPIGFEKPQTLAEIMAGMLKDGVQRELAERGLETFEEANDFDMDEDPSPISPHEDPEFAHSISMEQAMRAGIVEIPDYQAARELARKAQAVLDKYDEKGNLKKLPEGKA